jgi:DNA-binding NtrC family response regulator
MNPPARILLIDDDAAGRTALRRALNKQGYEVEAHGAGAPALARLEGGEEFDLVITDLKMPEIDGLEVLRRVKELRSELPVVLITAYGSEEAAFQTGRLGADAYIQKPLDLKVVRETVANALRQGRRDREYLKLAGENERLHRQLQGGQGVEAIVGVSPALERLRQRLRQVAPTNSSVLIVGESGTGKELIARALHDESKRAQRPFLPINCAAIPKDILESELFGHERGAFTGATARKPGKFEVAGGGTLFFDEIGELPLDMQAKLLRVLEEKAFMRVGGVEMVQVDVRIVAATNADLEALVERNDFRTDLYYRLKVVTLEILPLRSRPEDIPPLARHFLAHLASEYDRPGLELTPEAMEVLCAQPWPGNARELRNLLESAVVLSDGPVIGLERLPAEYGGSEPAEAISPAHPEVEFRAAEPPVPPAPEAVPTPVPSGAGESIPPAYERGLSMAELEKRHILRTLEEQGHNRTRAAKVLGIGRRTLQRKLEEYKEQGEEIPPPASE